MGDRTLAGSSEVVAAAVSPTAQPRVRRSVDWTSAFVRLLAIATLLGAWEALSLVYPPTFLPAPAVVLAQVGELIGSGELLAQAVPTVVRVVVGFVLALVAGTAVGIAMGIQRRVESFFEGYILLGLTVPGLAWSVLALMWFGVGEVAPVFAIFVVVSPMIAVNMWHGTKAIDPELNEMQRAFGASRLSLVKDVIVPQLLSHIFGASRFGFGLGWKVVVISEMFGLTSGIGYQIHRAFGLYSMRDVLAWTIGFTLIMIAFEYGVLRPLERRFLRWRPSVRV